MRNYFRNRGVLALLLVVGLLVFLFYQKEYQKQPSYLSGDEPHYVMMADSLVKDGDFNLKNDYELNRSTDYFPGPSLYPHLSPVIDQNSAEWYSIHTIGLPLVIAVPYKLFGVTGARIWMIFLQASSTVLFYLILKKYLKSKAQIWIGTGLFVTNPLLWQNIGSIFPDLLLVSIWGAMILLFGRKDRLSNLLIMGLLLLGSMTHTKGLILISPLVFFHIIWLAHSNGALTWAKRHWDSVVLLALGAAGYVLFLYTNYGIISPSGLYGDNGQLFGANPIYNVVAMITDRNKGLLVHFPLLIIAGPYILMMALDLLRELNKFMNRRLKLVKDHFLLAGIATGLTVLLITVVGFADWSGSTGPNGRSMLPFVMMLIFVVAKYMNILSRIETFFISLAAALGVWLSWRSIVNFEHYMSPGANSFWVDHFRALARLPMFPLEAVDAGRAAAISGIKILFVWLIANILLFILFRYKIVLQKRS